MPIEPEKQQTKPKANRGIQSNSQRQNIEWWLPRAPGETERDLLYTGDNFSFIR